MRNAEKDAREMSLRREKMLETGFRLFSEKTIDTVSMQQVARECGLGLATMYRYFNTKVDFVLAVSAKKWADYYREVEEKCAGAGLEAMTAGEELGFYLDLFIALYPGHRDLMRFDQNLSIYMHQSNASDAQLSPMFRAIALYSRRFHRLWEKGRRDGTLREELSEKELFVMSINIMLSLAGRCAVDWIDPTDRARDVTGELRLLREMILRTCISSESAGPAEENRKI